MEEITIKQAQRNNEVAQLALISVLNPNGVTNLTPISWWTFLSNSPAMIGFSLSKKSYSGSLMQNGTKLLLSIPNDQIAQEVLKAGKISGRNCNKSKELNIEMIGDVIQVPLHSKMVFDCDISKLIDAGDHIFYICNVIKCWINEEGRQLFAYDGYSKVSSLNDLFYNNDIATAYEVFSEKIFNSKSDNRYVYDINRQGDLFSELLFNESREIKLHFVYLPRVIGLRAVGSKKEVKYQRGILTFKMQDGMCHVTSKLEVSSQGVPTEYRGFAIITNPCSTGPACTCFLREINNAFGIFILFSFRLSSLEDIVKRKTRMSECMAVRKDDGTTFVYRLLISENFINDDDMKYFAGYLRLGTNENTYSGRELNILIHRQYIDILEQYFIGDYETRTNNLELYREIEEYFGSVNKNVYHNLIKEVKKKLINMDGIVTISMDMFNLNQKEQLLLLGWMFNHCLSARHDKIEKVLDDHIENIHKVIFPKMHNIKEDNNVCQNSRCNMKDEIISYLSSELSGNNIYKYSQKEQAKLQEWGCKCRNCESANDKCEILGFYKESETQRRRLLS